ncbi:hypothetical protein B0H16DRAFT_444069 [Mycena metata]|uniref:Uncharacterized protein n=1 Tax=Mycena metata TaxID=1033252 RepID=A0AAD7JKD6_9AGAR|nr:hypothetical protein B0H16DRAFT_444069 [Mycena metata]
MAARPAHDGTIYASRTSRTVIRDGRYLAVPFYPSASFEGPKSHDRHKRRRYYWTEFGGYPAIFTSSTGAVEFYGPLSKENGLLYIRAPFRRLADISRYAHRWASQHPHDAELVNMVASDYDTERAVAAVDNDGPSNDDLLSWWSSPNTERNTKSISLDAVGLQRMQISPQEQSGSVSQNQLPVSRLPTPPNYTEGGYRQQKFSSRAVFHPIPPAFSIRYPIDSSSIVDGENRGSGGRTRRVKRVKFGVGV